jgi:sugar transferase (PEP-CTERM/EpsH1 system associated)
VLEMRILFICHRFPFPPNRGGKIRPFEMIRHLSRNHSVDVASLAHSKRELQEGAGLKKYCAHVIAEVVPNAVRWTQAAKALFSATPSSVAYFHSRRLANRIHEAWSKDRFDAVILHCAFVAQYALGLKCGFRMLDLGDLDSGKWFEYSHQRPFPLSAGYSLEARKLRRYEKMVASQFDRCTFTTQGEYEDFRTLQVSVPCTVIPNGVDAAYFSRAARPSSDSAVIVFLGRMDYFPNVDGVCRFVRTVFPLIREKMPQAKLRIVGSDPTREVQKLSSTPGVTVTGFVSDVRPHLTDAAVAIAPLWVARGTQNKILQCMAMGIPVVCTPAAAKGVQASPGTHLLTAEEPEDFAHQVLEVLQNSKLRHALSEAAHQQVRQAHKWEESMGILDGILEQCPYAAESVTKT